MRFKHIPQQPRFNFLIKPKTSSSGRVYNIQIENEVLSFPSITTILGSGYKPWLEQWKQNLGKDKAAREQKRCANRGEIVHESIEKYLDNNFDVNSLQSDHRKIFNQIKPKLNRINNIYTQEEALFSRNFKVAGRVDCIGEYDGKLSIIDFKTSTNVKKDNMIEDYYLQCTAYALMYYEIYNILIENIVIIMCVEKGMVPLVFKKPIEDYILPLTNRINNYYNQRKQ